MKLLFECDRKGTILSGAHSDLLAASARGADLKLGLHCRPRTHDYEEVIPFSSVVIDGEVVIGIQPHHTASFDFTRFAPERKKSRAHPHRACLFYMSSRIHGVISFGFDNSQLRMNFPVRDKYEYYRWFADDSWEVVLDSKEDSLRGTASLRDLVVSDGRNVKISIEYNSLNYFLSPNIIYLSPSDSRRKKQLVAKTHPTIITPVGQNFMEAERFMLAEFMIQEDGCVSLFSYGEFDRPGDIRLIERIKRKIGIRRSFLKFDFHSNTERLPAKWLVRKGVGKSDKVQSASDGMGKAQTT